LKGEGGSCTTESQFKKLERVQSQSEWFKKKKKDDSNIIIFVCWIRVWIFTESIYGTRSRSLIDFDWNTRYTTSYNLLCLNFCLYESNHHSAFYGTWEVSMFDFTYTSWSKWCIEGLTFGGFSIRRSCYLYSSVFLARSHDWPPFLAPLSSAHGAWDCLSLVGLLHEIEFIMVMQCGVQRYTNIKQYRCILYTAAILCHINCHPYREAFETLPTATTYIQL
jgi:hypothetical protein